LVKYTMPLLQYRKQPLGTYQKPSRVIGTAPVPTPANPRTPSGPFSRPAPQQPQIQPPQAPRFNVPNPVQAQPVNPGGSLFNGSPGPGATFGMPPPIQIGLNNVKPGDTQVQQPTGTLPGNDANFGTQQQAMPTPIPQQMINHPLMDYNQYSQTMFGNQTSPAPGTSSMLVDQGPQATFGMPAPLGQVQIDPATGQVIGNSDAQDQYNLYGQTIFGNNPIASPGAGAMGAPSLFNPGTLGTQGSVL
jgi:hypothetical protein